jgi:hypothetical protein
VLHRQRNHVAFARQDRRNESPADFETDVATVVSQDALSVHCQF